MERLKTLHGGFSKTAGKLDVSSIYFGKFSEIPFVERVNQKH